MLLFANGQETAKIKVVGVGGGGTNAVNTMVDSGLTGVEFIAVNTDAQHLDTSLAPLRIQIGASKTKGLGAGGDPEVGKASAIEDLDNLREALAGADMVFITAGLGGGTGTGAAPVLSRLARELGALSVGVVTTPFEFEGSKRLERAQEGHQVLRGCVDALITIPNQRLQGSVGKSATFLEAFRAADAVLHHAVQGIADLITIRGYINVDFADVRAVMAHTGRTMMGRGASTGKARAVEAARRAITSTLLEEGTVHGARGILLNITGGADLTLQEVQEASMVVREAADPEANIIFGTIIREAAQDEVVVTVIATGFAPPGNGEVATSGRPTQSENGVSPMPRLGRLFNGGGERDEWDVPAFLRKRAVR